jgi:hypothetical protein
MCLPVSRLFWVSSLAYPNLLGTKGYVVVVVVVVFLNDLLWQVNSVDSNLEFQWQFHGLMLGILMGVALWRALLLT